MAININSNYRNEPLNEQLNNDLAIASVAAQPAPIATPELPTNKTIQPNNSDWARRYQKNDDLFIARLKQPLQTNASRATTGVKWGEMTRSQLSARPATATPIQVDSLTTSDPALELGRLHQMIWQFSAGQQQANELLATPTGRLQFEQIRKQILLGNDTDLFGSNGQIIGWDAKLRLMFLEPHRIDQIRIAGDNDVINQFPGAKLAQLATVLIGDSDPQVAARAEQARAQLATTANDLVQNQANANQILNSDSGRLQLSALQYLVMNRKEESVLGSLGSAFGWEAKRRLIIFNPNDVERIRQLNDNVALDQFDAIKRTRAVNEGAKIVSATRSSESNRVQVVGEFAEMMFMTPGKKLGIFGSKVNDGRGIDDQRRNSSPADYTRRSDGSLELKQADLALDPWGRNFDPYQFMPNIAYHNGEDALPIDPVFDGDAWPDNNVINYAHGAIGGQQPLKANVNFYQKDGYLVAQYGFYYADNKAGDYHKHDWHTTSVYLKLNTQTGNYEPQFLYNSWHFGGVMTKWNDLALDAQGRPTVMVGLGTHAARPLGRGDSLPANYANGLMLRGGDGQAVETSTGRSIGEQVSFFTTQDNVNNATRFDANGSDVERTRAGIYLYWQDHRHNPYSPSMFGL